MAKAVKTRETRIAFRISLTLFLIFQISSDSERIVVIVRPYDFQLRYSSTPSLFEENNIIIGEAAE